MSTNTKSGIGGSEGGAAVVRSEPVGRVERDGGAAPDRLAVEQWPLEFRERLSDELIDELLAGARTEEEVVGPGGVLAQLTKRLVERALRAELTEHLGYEPHPMSRTRSRQVARATRVTVRRRRRSRPSTA